MNTTTETRPAYARRTYYSAVLDPSICTDLNDLYAEDAHWPPPPGTPEQPANCMSSLCYDGYHRPAIDIDLPCELVPSSTEGHYHLLIDHPMETLSYMRLLRDLASAGLVQEGYAASADRRAESVLRLPGCQKMSPGDDTDTPPPSPVKDAHPDDDIPEPGDWVRSPNWKDGRVGLYVGTDFAGDVIVLSHRKQDAGDIRMFDTRRSPKHFFHAEPPVIAYGRLLRDVAAGLKANR